jgi:hypothetical protein
MAAQVRGRWLLLVVGALLLVSGLPRLAAGAATLESRRTASATIVALGGGRYRAEISTAPLNYADSAGAYQLIDTALRPSTRTGYRFANTTNGLRSFFAPTSSARDAVRLETDDAWLTWATYDVLGTGVAVQPSPADERTQVNGSLLRYSGALPGIAEWYAPIPGGLSHSVLVLNRPVGLQGAALAHRSLLRLAPGLRLFADGREQPGTFVSTGALEIRDAAGILRMQLLPPRVSEQRDRAGVGGVAATYRVIGSGTFRILSLDAPADWLAAPERSYPVMIGFVAVASPAISARDTTIADTDALPAAPTNLLPFAAIGRDLRDPPVRGWRTLVSFGLEPLLDPSVGLTRITSATLELPFAGYAPSSTCGSLSEQNSQQVLAYRLDTNWDEHATWNIPWFTPGGDFSTLLDTSRVAADQVSGTMVAWNITAAAQAWAAGAPNNGLLLKLRDEQAYSTCSLAFFSSEASIGENGPAPRPRLLITFESNL